MLLTILVVKVLVFESICAAYISDPKGPIVRSKVGVIRGVRAPDGEYDMFMGIPYARVDMRNPFGDSLPYPKFQGIFEANDDSAQCVQIHDMHGLGGNLDCLQLNIYVPNNAKNLPVMVYMFGGSFRQGSFTKKYYGPRFLMRYGVILVIMNYRVGSFGTLCLDIPESPGNQALKDQESALKWIQNNIKEFGGDPGKVTLFGHSGGAVSVSLHVLYAKEKLFHQAIMASGTGYYPRRNNQNNIFVLKISKYLGFETDNLKDAHAFLSTVEPSRLIEAETHIGYRPMPCVEKSFDNVTNFMPEDIIYAEIKNDTIIPILIGNSADESFYLFDNVEPDDLIYNNLKAIFNFNDLDFKAAYKLIHKFYIDDNEMKVTKRKFIDFFTDFNFVYPNKRYIDKYLKKGATIYYYLFPYSGGRNFIKNQRNLTNTLATHGDELGYIFDISFPYMNKDTKEDYIVLDNFLTMLTNFAKYGNPTPTKNLLPKWKPISNDTWYYMNIDTTLSVREGPFKEQIAFWDNFYKLYGHLENAFT